MDWIIPSRKDFEENGIEFVLEDCQTEDEIIENAKMQMRFWLFIDRLLQE